MNWQSKLQLRTRDPAFLWRIVIAIVGVGVVLGWIAEQLTGAPRGPMERITSTQWNEVEAFAAIGDWWRVWWGIPGAIFNDSTSLGVVALAMFAGCCWLAFLWHVLRVESVSDWRVWATMLAMMLGALSVWPTMFFSLWQEQRWGLQLSDELVPGLRFFILGVGLREEFAKLLCLLPLMAILVPKRNEMMALIASACVGLGFATEENINYFVTSQATSTMGRFLTANPFHMALTGLIGLNVYRAIRDPKNWGPQAVAMFFLLVIAHGIYDAAFVLPDLVEYSLGGMIVFALVMYQFFHEVRTMRPKGHDTISLTATFLCAVSLLAAVTFIYISAVLGTKIAADALVADIVGMALMVYLFLREMPETLISV